MQPHPHFAGLRQPLRRISRLLDGTVEVWRSVDGSLLGHQGPSCHGGGRKRKGGSAAANRQRIPRLPVTFWTAVASEARHRFLPASPAAKASTALMSAPFPETYVITDARQF